MLVIHILWLQAALAMAKAQLPALDDLLGEDNTVTEEPAGSEEGGLVPGLQDLIGGVGPVPTVVDDIVDTLPGPTDILDSVAGAPATTAPGEEEVATPEPVPAPVPTGEEAPAVEETPAVETPAPEPTPEEPPVAQLPEPEVEEPAVEEPTPALAPSPDAIPVPAPAPIATPDPASEQQDAEPAPNTLPTPSPLSDVNSGAGGVALLPLPSPPSSQDGATPTPVPTPAPTTNEETANTSPFLTLVTPANGSPFISVFVPPQPTQVNAVIDDTDTNIPPPPPSTSDTTNPLTNTNLSPSDNDNPLADLPAPSTSATPSIESGIPLSTKIGVAAGLGAGSLILLIVMIYIMWHKRMGNSPFSRGHKRSGSAGSNTSRDLESGHQRHNNSGLPVQERQKLDWESEHDVAFDFGFGKAGEGGAGRGNNWQETKEEDRLPAEMEARMGVGEDGRAEFRR
ncbi:hypothetical protein QBC36DRAFT_303893 [Triangularia setosa]|uniref:Uncharacterized protein n=1 Tax=Triangularia setosa TaxID=2587417 RepID=A0AAN7A4N0_9PEZI|nr:hypothetical protein QBC36DRAFT_303893 [Podospora setosa]